MSRHDYSQNTVSNVSSTIVNCKNAVENTILSTESMSYSWDTGIIHNVVTWFEVLQINMAKAELDDLFQKADSKFDNVVRKVGEIDTISASSLETGLTTLSAIKQKAELVWAFTKLYPTLSVVGCFDNLHTFINQVDEDLNIVDFDKLSDAEKKAYFDRLNDIPDDQLTEEDKAKIKSFLDHLSNIEFNGTISQEQRNSMEQYIALYEKLHPDASELIEKLCREHGNKELNNLLQLKYRIYSMGISYQLAEKLCNSKNAYNSCDYMKKQLADFDGKAMVDQGNFHLCDMKLEKSEDGSCNISFTAKQSSVAKSYGAAIVYDKHGNVDSVCILDRYKNPTGFVDSVSSLYDELFKGGDFQETEVSLEIPKGGYIEITDDPDNIALIQVGKYVDEEIKSEIEDKIKGVVTNPIEESLKNPGKHATTQVTSASAALYNANVAYETVKTTAEGVDKLETIFWTNQQKGSGSLILYN